MISESKEKPLILLFTVKWGGTAHILETFFEELIPDYPHLIIYKIDADVDQDLCTQFGVSQIPTTIFLFHGKIKDYIPGMLSKKKLRQKFDSLV